MDFILRLRIKKSFLQRIMILLFIVGVCNFIHAGGTEWLTEVSSLQPTKRISINMKDATVREVIYAIQKQSNIDIFIRDTDIDKLSKVNFVVKDVLVKDALSKLLSGTNYTINSQGDGVAIFKNSREIKAKVTIKGKIIDESKKPIVGATVIVSNTAQGAITDDRGEFSIATDIDAVLDVSFVGYLSLKYIVKQQVEDLVLVMKTDAMNVEDVVVTGYQTISKERVTGSYDIVNKEQIEKPTSNIATALIGTVAGVHATVDVNGDPKFEIRGKASLYANATPLVVVDGFAIEGDFSSINPNDVESITILKDAAAASIWGARSANGVIIVTTKSGKEAKGSVRVELNSFVKFSPRSNLDYTLGKASSEESIKFDQLSFNRWGTKQNVDGLIYVNTSASPYTTLASENALGYVSDDELNAAAGRFSKMNNQKQINKYLFNNPFTQQHNISIASSTEKSINNVTMMYEDRESFLKGNDDQKVTINYRNTTNLFKWLSFRFSGMFQYNNANNNSEGLSAIKSIAPYEMLVNEATGERTSLNKLYKPNMDRYWDLSRFPYSDLSYNPITEMENTLKNTKTIHSRFQVALDFKIANGINFTSQLQYELVNYNKKEFFKEETHFTRYEVDYYTHWDQAKNTYNPNLPKGGILDQSRSKVNSLTVRNQFNLNKVFGKHAINAIAGVETVNRNNEGFTYARTYGYDDDRLSVGTLPNGVGSYTNNNLKIYNWTGNNTTIYKNVNNAFTYNTDKFFSLFVNAAYTFDDKYTLSGSARTDASNMITDDPKYRYSPFWSLGGSWNIRNEEFMKKADFVDRLILRTTYGYNGNVDNSTSFATLINFSPINDPNTGESTASISSYGNPTLRWEKTGTLNIGVDYSLFSGKLRGKIDFYNKNATDLIASVSIPSANGTGTQKMNVADMNNKGIELVIGTVLPIYHNKIKMYADFNIAYNKNKITKLYVNKYSQGAIMPFQGEKPAYVQGMDANTIFGCEYAGMYNVGTAEKPNMQPKIRDVNGNLYELGAWAPVDVFDFAIAQGSTVAPWVGGLTLGFKLYNFDVSCIMTGKFGHIFKRTSYNYNDSRSPNGRLDEILTADHSQMMPLPQNDTESRYYFWDRYWKHFTYLTESASHIRMQELNISYNLSLHLTNKLKLSMVKIYGQANNVFSIYANKYKEDPEYAYGTYRPTASFTFGIKIGF